MPKEDYYELLGISRDASADEIKKAFRKKAIEFHPDRNQGNPETENSFKKINEAYSVLSDQSKRQRYDQFGHAGGGQDGGFGGFSSGGNFNFSDIFEDAFGGESIFESFFGGSGGRGGRRRGADLKYNLRISLEEAFQGKETTISFAKKDTCESCSGNGTNNGRAPQPCGTCGGQGKIRQNRGVFSINTTCSACRGNGVTLDDPCRVCRGAGVVNKNKSIKIKIPAGIDEGQSIKIPGEGEVAMGVSPGDLYVSVELEDHLYFERREHDLYCEMPISVAQAVLGSSFQLKTISGKKIKIKIPATTQPDAVLRVRGEGMPFINSSGKGDLYIVFKVQVPTKLGDKQKKLYKELLTESGDEEITPHKKIVQKKSFFGF